MGKEKKFNFVYQTKNMINGKLYIGVHCTDNLKDGYIGCGITRQSNASRKSRTTPFTSSVNKYGYENFKREILCFFDTEEEAYEEEAWLVDENWVNRKDTYNVSLGGRLQTSVLQHARGRDHYTYISDIYVVDIKTKTLVGVYPTSMEIERSLGLNHSKIGMVLNRRAISHKGYFFTRDLNSWYTDYLARKSDLKDFQSRNVKKVQRRVSVTIEKEGVIREFETLGECMVFFNLSPEGRTWFKKKIIRDNLYKGYKVWL